VQLWLAVKIVSGQLVVVPQRLERNSATILDRSIMEDKCGAHWLWWWGYDNRCLAADGQRNVPKQRFFAGSILDKGSMFAQGEAGTEKKNGIFMYNKNKMVCYKRNFKRGWTGGTRWQGRRKGGRRTRHARSCGHVCLPKADEIREMPLNWPT
jgi:hypothetical protein